MAPSTLAHDTSTIAGTLDVLKLFVIPVGGGIPAGPLPWQRGTDSSTAGPSP